MLVSASAARSPEKGGSAHGACRTPESFTAVFAQFREKKDAIYALYKNEPALAPKTREQALRYYDEFYKTSDDPRVVKREFLEKCGNQT